MRYPVTLTTTKPNQEVLIMATQDVNTNELALDVQVLDFFKSFSASDIHHIENFGKDKKPCKPEQLVQKIMGLDPEGRALIIKIMDIMINDKLKKLYQRELKRLGIKGILGVPA